MSTASVSGTFVCEGNLAPRDFFGKPECVIHRLTCSTFEVDLTRPPPSGGRHPVLSCCSTPRIAIRLRSVPWRAQTSKYCLFNRWKTPEPCDDSLTILTRRYLSVALVIHILVSLQYYAGWPFDDLCPTSRVRTLACFLCCDWPLSGGVGRPRLRRGWKRLACLSPWPSMQSLHLILEDRWCVGCVDGSEGAVHVGGFARLFWGCGLAGTMNRNFRLKQRWPIEASSLASPPMLSFCLLLHAAGGYLGFHR